MKHLVIAEKPSVGRDIARVLKCSERNPGFMSGDDYLVTWAFGHLVTNKEPDEIDPKYAEWKMEDLPIIPDPIPLKVLPKTKNQFDLVASLMNSEEVDQVICATDAGREGELIFRYIYQMAGCRKPVQRLWISSMTPQAIREGFQNLRPAEEYDDLYESALCRSDADWLIGMNGSRAFSIPNNTILSVGRVQSPTLAILVEREIQRRNFVPEQYWILTGDFDGYDGEWFDPHVEGENAHWIREDRIETMRLFTEQLPGKWSTVKEYFTEKKSVPSPQLFDLTALQREANRRYGFSAKKTLQITQDLYEKRKAVTYPRTDSRFLSHDMANTLKSRLEKLTNPEWSSCVKEALASEKKLFGRYINAAGISDHHAIIPTGYTCGDSNWTDGEKKVFDLIVRRYIAMFLPDREIVEQTAITEVEGELFRSHGEIVISDGWGRIARETDNVQPLPILIPGHGQTAVDAELAQKETLPPPPHTDASLLYAMEHAGEHSCTTEAVEEEVHVGLGTPATRADTIEKLIKRSYVKRRGKALFPTEDGIKLVEILPDFLSSPDMTVDWEKKLASISRGEMDPKTYMQEIRDLTKDVVHVDTKAGNYSFGPKVLGSCPLCGENVVEGEKDYYCRNKGCQFHIWKAKKGEHPYISPEGMETLLLKSLLKTEKGTFQLAKEDPFVCFEKAAANPQPSLAGKKLPVVKEILKEKGIVPVDKTGNGGAFWIPGGKDLKPLIMEFKKMDIEFIFAEDSKALKHKSGWWSDFKHGL